MSWTKPFKAVQDFILGHQSVNRAIANEKAMRDELDIEHYVPDGALGATRGVPLPAGRHVYDNIPKAVVSVTVTTTEIFGTTHGSMDVDLSVPPYVVGVDRLGVGQYLVRTAYMPQFSDAPWAEHGVKSTGVGVVRACSARWNPSAGGFLVTTLEQPSAGAAFEPTDFSFDLFIFSR